MTDPRYDAVGMGNAIVDVLTHTDDAFLEQHNLDKGMMTLIDEEQAVFLYGEMAGAEERSGGSAANTMAGLASLGGTCAYIGKVRNDHLGGAFARDLESCGVDFTSTRATEGPPTGRCYVLVTPDAQRTMQTFLGVSVDLGPDDVDTEQIEGSRVTYLEGYLYDKPAAKQAFAIACVMAHAADRKVALSLSDPFCVDRHREDFQNLISQHVDLLFGNEDEMRSLYEVDSLLAAVARLQGEVELAAVTRGAKGSMLVTRDQTVQVAAEPVERVVDTTGAGDLFAAGMLYGYTHGLDLESMGRISSLAASEIISHLGARPETDLSQLVAERL